MDLKIVEELQQEQKLLRVEISQLREQMNHIMGILGALLKERKISLSIIAPEVHTPVAQRQYHPVVAQVEAYGPSPMDLPQPSFSKLSGQQSLFIPQQSQGNQGEGKDLDKALRKQQKRPHRSDPISMMNVEAPQGQAANQNQNRNRSHFDPIPMSYT